MRLSWAIPLLSLSASASSSDAESLLQIHHSDVCLSGKCQPHTTEPPVPEPTEPEKPVTTPAPFVRTEPPKKPTTTPEPFVAIPTTTPEPVVTIGTVPPTTGKPKPPKTTPEPVAEPEPVAVCILQGDPHIKTFDREEKDRDFYSYGDYWLVKRQDIWIQARYWSTNPKGKAAVRILAISEPRVNGKVEPPVLIVNADPSSTGPNADKNWASPPYSTELEGDRNSFEFTFAPDSEVSVHRGRGLLNVMIEMPRPVSGGQSGHCGNFNGNAADDVLDTEMVDDEDLLLAPHPTSWGSPSGTPCSDAVQQKAVNDCTVMYAAAEDNDPVDIAACVVDYCSAGPDVAEMGLVDDLCVKKGKKGKDCDTKLPPAVQAVIVDNDHHDGKKGKKGTPVLPVFKPLPNLKPMPLKPMPDDDWHDGKKGKKGAAPVPISKPMPMYVPKPDHDQHDGKKGKKGKL